MRLQEFDFQVKHREGIRQQHVDGLSRNPPEDAPAGDAQASVAEPVQVAEDLGAAPARALVAMLGPAPPAEQDVWENALALAWIRGREPAGGWTDRERLAAAASAAGYIEVDGRVYATGIRGDREVLPPGERESAIQAVHAQLGHYGRARTLDAVRSKYFWRGLASDVQRVVAASPACDRAKARFDMAEQKLHSLPLLGLGGRWCLDLTGELPLTRRNRRYILLMIEHTSKWLEAVALPSKASPTIHCLR